MLSELRFRLGLQNLDLGLGLALCGLASLLGLLQPSLDLGVELVDLLLELCLPVGVSLCTLCLQLRKVAFHGGDVLILNPLLHL